MTLRIEKNHRFDGARWKAEWSVPLQRALVMRTPDLDLLPRQDVTDWCQANCTANWRVAKGNIVGGEPWGSPYGRLLPNEWVREVVLIFASERDVNLFKLWFGDEPHGDQ